MRTDQTKVETVLGGTVSTPLFDQCVRIASRYIEANSLGAYSEEILTDIETYLTAHFVIMTTEKGGLVMQRVGDAEEQYTKLNGRFLYSTRFGMMVVTLDTSGTLMMGSNAVFEVI